MAEANAFGSSSTRVEATCLKGERPSIFDTRAGEKTCDKYTCPKFGGKGVPSCVEGSGSGGGSDSESSPGGAFKMDDKTIYKATKLWFEDEAKAIQKYAGQRGPTLDARRAVVSPRRASRRCSALDARRGMN